MPAAQADWLPFDLAKRCGCSINLETAKALGLTIPQSILARADRVIELEVAATGRCWPICAQL